MGVMLVRQRGVHLVHRHRVHRRHLVFLFPLHPPVLEPDLDLTFRQAEGVGDLDPSTTRQVAVEMELLLQLEGLVPRVRRPLTLGLAVLIYRVCKKKRINVLMYSFPIDWLSGQWRLRKKELLESQGTFHWKLLLGMHTAFHRGRPLDRKSIFSG